MSGVALTVFVGSSSISVGVDTVLALGSASGKSPDSSSSTLAGDDTLLALGSAALGVAEAGTGSFCDALVCGFREPCGAMTVLSVGTQYQRIVLLAYTLELNDVGHSCFSLGL